MSPTDKAFADGLKTASQIARASATNMLRSGVGAKYLGAHAALEQLADDLHALAQPPAAAAAAPTEETRVAALDIAIQATNRETARDRGYTGDECQECGSFAMVRNGTCLKCENCGSTTGCSCWLSIAPAHASIAASASQSLSRRSKGSTAQRPAKASRVACPNQARGNVLAAVTHSRPRASVLIKNIAAARAFSGHS